MSAHRLLILFLLFAGTVPSPAQFLNRNQQISNQDLIEALQFAGVDIFKFKIDSHKHDYDFFITVDEYDSTHGLRRIDTLLADQTKFDLLSHTGKWLSAYVDQFRFLTKVLNNKYDTIYLRLGANHISTWKTLHIAPEFAKKHYWVRFKDQRSTVGKRIPMLFFGSEWTETHNGVQVTRFCSLKELEPTLQGPTIKLIPHYFIVSYVLSERH